jgi:hypothetical protein
VICVFFVAFISIVIFVAFVVEKTRPTMRLQARQMALP